MGTRCSCSSTAISTRSEQPALRSPCRPSSPSRERASRASGPVRLGMAAGLVSGPCHFFLVGRPHRELIVCGPSASATLGLEDAAESGEVLVSARTAEALTGLVAAERDGAFLLRSERCDASCRRCRRAGGGLGDLTALLPPTLRGPIATGAVEAEHRQATARSSSSAAPISWWSRPTRRQRRSARSRTSCRRKRSTWASPGSSRTSITTAASSTSSPAHPSSAGDDEDRMLRALRDDRRRGRRAGDRGRCEPRSGARRADRLADPDDLRRDGRHREPRGTAGGAGREGGDPGDGRRPATCPHEVRDARAASF